jgi:single-strand DNA-binding protein
MPTGPITVVGNVTGEPELRFTPSGAAVCNFTVAETPRTYDKQAQDWKDGTTIFWRCAVWREAAENAAESLNKGARVVVTGKMEQREFDDRDGNKRTSLDILVDEVAVSLRYATAKPQKTTRGGGGGGGGDWGSSTRTTSARQQPAEDPWATGTGAGTDEAPF